MPRNHHVAFFFQADVIKSKVTTCRMLIDICFVHSVNAGTQTHQVQILPCIPLLTVPPYSKPHSGLVMCKGIFKLHTINMYKRYI